MYKVQPFYTVYNKSSKRWYGVFYNSLVDGTIDLGAPLPCATNHQVAYPSFEQQERKVTSFLDASELTEQTRARYVAPTLPPQAGLLVAIPLAEPELAVLPRIQLIMIIYQLDYYILTGDGTLPSIITAYASLVSPTPATDSPFPFTASPTLPPLSQFGYLSSSLSLAADPKAQEAIIKFLKTSRSEGFPVDGLYVSLPFAPFLHIN